MTDPHRDDTLDTALRQLASALDDDGFSQRVLRRLPPRAAADGLSRAALQQRQQRLRHDRLATVVGLVGGLAVAEAVALLANTAPASGPERAALLALAVVASSAAALWILARTDR